MLLANYRVTLFVATIIASSVVVPGKFWLIRSINSVIGCLCLQFWILLTRTISPGSAENLPGMLLDYRNSFLSYEQKGLDSEYFKFYNRHYKSHKM